MASDPAELQHASPRGEERARPLAGSRAQSLQRLQIGLFGLAAMVLLVGPRQHHPDQRAGEPGARRARSRGDRRCRRTMPRASDPLAAAGVVPDEPEAEDKDAAIRAAALALPSPPRCCA
jgi:hypothetical protein